MDPEPDMDLDQTPIDRRETLRQEASANAAHSAELARHIRTFAQKVGPEPDDEHWKPALPFDPKA